MDKSKKAGRDAVIADIRKRYGHGAIFGPELADAPEVIPTGCATLNEALGIGGWPRGRVVEVFGPEMSGKTTMALHAIAETQRQGGVAAFIDAEHALDPRYANALGVDLDAMLVSQPSHGEEALDIAETLTRSGAVDLIAIDSVANIVPRAEIEGEMGDAHVGLQARLMSQGLRKLTAIASRTGTLIMFTNQLREKRGITFGSGEMTTGGNALKFYASVRVDLRKKAAIGSSFEGNVRGGKHRARVVKNKLAPPFQQAEFNIIFGEGIQ